MNDTITLAVIAFAIGVGLGEVLMEVKYPEVRRWGRAMKLATPIVAGIWALLTFYADQENLYLKPAGIGAFILFWACAMGLLRYLEAVGALRPPP